MAVASPSRSPEQLKAWALAYASEHLSVFLLRRGSKAPLISRAEGGRGFYDATTDAEQIEAWWERYPEANIGIRTGAASGVLVIDVDPRHGGSLEAVYERFPELRETWAAQSANGGWHLYVRYPGFEVTSGQHALGQGVDVKCDGGYIVAHPSWLASGGRYSWVRGVETPLLACPPALIEALEAYMARGAGRDEAGRDAGETPRKSQRYSPVVASLLAEALATTGEGAGDDTGYAFARKLLAAGCGELEALDALLAYGRAATTNQGDPFSERDARRWLGSAGKSEHVARSRRAMVTPTTHAYEDENNERDEGRGDSSSNSSISSSYQSRSYPDRLGEAAYYGLAGEITRAIEPHTEADPAALLVQLLASFGNAVGRTAYAVAEASHHYPNLFVALVGNTAKGRKGSSWAQILRCMGEADGAWAEHHLASGLSSGEGLIHMLRDTPADSPARDAEPLLSDKRLLAHQGEFASVLKMMAREGNTLSDILRLAWDGVALRVLTKQAPERATGAHVSLIGHITRNELLRYLTATEAANGFGNRFLWVCVTRSKRLPDGGNLEAEALRPLVERLRGALEYAREAGERVVTRDPEAREMWREQYARLSDGLPGLLGAMLARAEAQTMRLSMIYALLDRSHVVRRKHLEAALALWRYAEASARYIFGDALGDPVADTILHALRDAGEGGLTRTEISALFGRNKDAAELARALRLLVDERLAHVRAEETGGRRAERWRYGAPLAA